VSGAAIEVRGLSVRRSGGFRLAVPELTLAPGERVACVGPSGSGKSTLLECLCGLLVPEAGSVSVAGRDLAAASDAERRRFRLERIGLLFQDFALLEHLSVRENALLPWLLERSERLEEREAELADSARALGLDGLLERRPRALSQGERQRVALARALLGEPELILADEPTGNLDAATAARVTEHVLARAARTGATLVFVTHALEARARFERVIDVTQLGEAAR
jgi:putative ABC transport system ATP-binding protein